MADTLCHLCGENRFRIVEEGETPYRVLRCLRCSLVFVDPRPEQQALGDHYDEEYYREWTGVQRQRRLRMWEARLDRLERRVPRGCLLDVGCAEGTFLEQARRRGWKVSGTELSAFAAAEASRRLGKEIFCGELGEARFPDGSFDVITLWHVLEYMRDPGNCLREIRRIIRPQGFLLIAVPNVDDRLMQMAYRLVRGRPKRLFLKKDREIHLTHFSARTIGMFLEKTGFAPSRIGPDYGIIEPGKRLINAAAAACGLLGGLKIYNALEIHARPVDRGGRT